MLRTIFGWFGYSKIPTAVVQLSIEQETFLEKVMEIQTNEEGKEIFS
jgi:hypothetical protein